MSKLNIDIDVNYDDSVRESVKNYPLLAEHDKSIKLTSAEKTYIKEYKKELHN